MPVLLLLILLVRDSLALPSALEPLEPDEMRRLSEGGWHGARDRLEHSAPAAIAGGSCGRWRKSGVVICGEEIRRGRIRCVSLKKSEARYRLVDADVEGAELVSHGSCGSGEVVVVVVMVMTMLCCECVDLLPLCALRAAQAGKNFAVVVAGQIESP